MRTIYKYTLPVTDIARADMPAGAKVLTVQVQRGEVCIWALVDPSNREETRRFRIAGTGHPIDDDVGSFIGTVQLGALVFHIFNLS